jgi:hypothetical protein
MSSSSTSAVSVKSAASAPRWPPAFGDHIKVDRGAYSHHGIVSSHPDEPLTVIHWSKASTPAAIREEPFLTHFLFDCPLSAVSIVPYDRLYSPADVVARARQHLGESAYDLAANNCEHFSSWCHTDVWASQQVQAHANGLMNAGTVALVVGSVMMFGGMLLSRKAHRRA